MNLIKSTGTFSFFTIISRLLGYVRDILIAVFLFLPCTYHSLMKNCNLTVVANVGAFLFFTNAITPDIDLAMFYWLTSSDGLGIDAVMVGIISAVGFVAMFLSVMLFNAYFCYYSYRTLFTTTLLLLSLLSLVDLVLVLRLNTTVGINSNGFTNVRYDSFSP